MSLSSLQLDAFLEVAQTGSFSEAARRLHVTQSALSQRVLKLEEELGTTLLVREPSGLRLTSVGDELLRYCRVRAGLEEEFVARLRPARPGALAGVARVAGFSTVSRSVILPALKPLFASEPGVTLELLSRETRELPDLLRRGETDFVLLDRPIDRAGHKSHPLGDEINVLVEPAKGTYPDDVFLDHDARDETTLRFMEHQRRPLRGFRRAFLDEIYAILDGVALGLGRAVVPRHLALRHRGVRIARGYTPFRSPVYLIEVEQAFASQLHLKVRKELLTHIPGLLGGGSASGQ